MADKMAKVSTDAFGLTPLPFLRLLSLQSKIFIVKVTLSHLSQSLPLAVSPSPHQYRPLTFMLCWLGLLVCTRVCWKEAKKKKNPQQKNRLLHRCSWRLDGHLIPHRILIQPGSMQFFHQLLTIAADRKFNFNNPQNPLLERSTLVTAYIHTSTLHSIRIVLKLDTIKVHNMDVCAQVQFKLNQIRSCEWRLT